MAGLQRGDELPPDIQSALHEAMNLEHVPESWYDDLAWICANESSGHTGVRNSTSTASGLFQLTSAQWGLMPAGKDSLGNAVDEARGGIRYIKSRYGDAANAKTFWLSHTHHGHHFY
jgi:SLT domain-containing protein